MFSFLSGGTSTPEALTASTSAKPATLLVIIPDTRTDYGELFKDAHLTDGRSIKVVQAQWSEVLVTSDAAAGTLKCYVHVNNSISKGTHQPDFVLIRSEVRGVSPTQDYRNMLYGMMYAQIPSLNSLHSIYCFLERPVVFAELNRLNKRLGSEVFPIVRQSYFSSHREMMYGDSYPAVVKVGHAHAGYGKMKVDDHHVLEDVRSVLALSPSYATMEPFIEGSHDLRIQKIGPHLRAFKRTSVSGSWKTNTGSSHVEEIEVTDRYRTWIDAAADMFGGLDVCTVDAIHDSTTGEELIMEVNGTASGFSPYTQSEDNILLRDLVVEKMNQCCCHLP